MVKIPISCFRNKQAKVLLKICGMKCIVASSYHPKTSGKLECYCRTKKAKVNLFTYDNPEALIDVMERFVSYYNYERYHEALRKCLSRWCVLPMAGTYYGSSREGGRAKSSDAKIVNLSFTQGLRLYTNYSFSETDILSHLDWRRRFLIVSILVERVQEAGNVYSPESSVTTTGDTVWPYYSLVAPPSHRVAMDMEKLSYFSYRQHGPHLVSTYHILPPQPLIS